MATVHKVNAANLTRTLPRAHEWVMISGFALGLPQDMPIMKECMLEPLAVALEPYELDDRLLCEISAEVEQAGEELRRSCLEGKLEYVNVRVHMSSRALRAAVNPARPWRYFIVKQITSSESDNLESVEDPRCFIDLNIYQD